jgi:protein involved in polysaccharide export with SLBB domain
MLELKAFRIWFGATLRMAAISCGQALSAQEKPQPTEPAVEYRIVAGDVIQVDVWKEPEITRTIPVRPDGTILLPLVDNVKASGLTAMQLAALMRQKLESKIPNPQVTVTVVIHGTNLPSTPVAHPPPPLAPELRQKCCVA